MEKCDVQQLLMVPSLGQVTAHCTSPNPTPNPHFTGKRLDVTKDMQRISNATCSLGLIAFFLENSSLRYNAPTQKEHTAKQSVTAFVSTIEELSDILESLDTSPRNPMAPLPPGFEKVAGACAADIGDMERQMRENSKLGPYGCMEMVFHKEDMERMDSVLKAHIESLGPYAESLARYALIIVI